jgi:hypothetical protein
VSVDLAISVADANGIVATFRQELSGHLPMLADASMSFAPKR